MKNINILLFLIILTLGLSACETTQATPEAIPVPPTPMPGMATVTGRVVSKDTNEPLVNMPVRLAEVYRPEGQESDDDLYILDQAFSPGALTDDEGNFIVPDVDAIDYVIIIGDVETTYEVITYENGKPAVWKTAPDEILVVGVLEVSITTEGF